jgi:type IV fimbrial biogenesis protein FimT
LPYRRARGFTLLELMVVVVMIAVLVTLSIPSISRQLRDRRNNQAAHEISALYRAARARAMGRGAAVMVRFGTATRGAVQVLESVRGTPGRNGKIVTLPGTSCQGTQWTGGDGFRVLETFDPTANGAYDNVTITFHESGGGDQSDAEICFSPLGRPFIRFNAGTPFLAMASVPYLEIAPVDGVGLTRTVLVVPSGASRLSL